MAALAKNLTLIFTFGVVQEVSSFIKYNEKIYINSRVFDDLTEKGKQDKGYSFIEEMTAAARVLPQYSVMFGIQHNRVQLHKFAHWLIKVLNFIDEKWAGVIYILPESFVEIPFEIFRAFKRGNIPLYETEQDKVQYKEEMIQVYKNQRTTFSEELVRFIAKHFFDEKIANPDFKEIYLTRLNIMMQSQIYISMFEKDEHS